MLFNIQSTLLCLIFQIETTTDYQSSTLSRVSEYIEEAKAASSHTEEILNRFAKFYTPLIVLAAVLVSVIPIIIAAAKVCLLFSGVTRLVAALKATLPKKSYTLIESFIV